MSTKRNILICSLSLSLFFAGASLSQVQAQNNTKRTSRPLQSLFMGSGQQYQDPANSQEQKWQMPRPFQGIRSSMQESRDGSRQYPAPAQSPKAAPAPHSHQGNHYSAKYPQTQPQGHNHQAHGNYQRSPQQQHYASMSPSGKGQVPSMEELMKPSMSRASAKEVMSRIPISKMNEAEQKVVRTVLSDYTIYRRLPMAGGICNPEVFDYFLTHPDTVVGLWEAMGSTQLSMVRTSPNSFDIQDDTGTAGSLYILYQDDEMTVAFCKGFYRGPITNRKIEGDMILVLQMRYTETETRQPITVCRMDSFVRINNMGAELFGRAFAPALGKVADTNFEQTVSFICSLSQLAEESPASFAEMINKLVKTTQQSRTNLYTTVERTYKQAEQRAEGKLPLYQLVAKKNQPIAGTARLLSRESGSGVPSAPIQKTTIASPVPKQDADPFDKVPELKMDQITTSTNTEVKRSSLQTLKNLKSVKKNDPAVPSVPVNVPEQTVSVKKTVIQPEVPSSEHLPSIPDLNAVPKAQNDEVAPAPKKSGIGRLNSLKKTISVKSDPVSVEKPKAETTAPETKSAPAVRAKKEPVQVKKSGIQAEKTAAPQPLKMEEKKSGENAKKDLKPIPKKESKKKSAIEEIPEDTWKTVKK
ncbi:MAG: hypothetical protein Q4G69_11250 [Planctomycetia bacterium]|nr:hypothetical protein [Planctomycetia bacterium]